MRIALCGKMGSGKSYIAKLFSEKYNCKIISFAGRVKKLANELFDMKEKDRNLLQNLSQKIKEIDKNVWVNVVKKEINKYENVVIDDLRFPNEYQMLRDLDFIVIRLNIDRDIRIDRLSGKYKNFKDHLQAMEHVSETLLEDFVYDFEVVSDQYAFEKIEKFMSNRD